MNKLSTARLLAGVTILLIILFQAYWLQKVYKEERSSFSKATDLTFRETLYRLQAARFTSDSMVFKSLPGDDVFMPEVMESVHKIRVLKKDSSRKVFISLNTDAEPTIRIKRDSLVYSKTANTRAANLPDFLKESKTINDTLALSKIDSLYSKLLDREGISTEYILQASRNPQKATNIYTTRNVPVGIIDPMYYRASFSDPTTYLLKRISIPVIVSVLLIGLTVLSLVFLYRNLVAQQKLTDIKNEFIGNITHELKTPIATVSVAIEAMKNFNALHDPGRTQEYLGIAGQELNRLSLLVDKVLRLSMFEKSQLDLKYSTFDLLKLLQTVVKSMQLQFEKTHASVTISPEGDDFAIDADQNHISSVIYNLLDNAIKYSRSEPEIDISAIAHETDIEIRIKDNGIGIDPLYMDKIFDKFFRVPHGERHDVKGYGLGLSYAAHIIKNHRGSIDAVSDGKNGTTFTIKLPRNHAG